MLTTNGKLFDDVRREPGQFDRADRSMPTWDFLNRSARLDVENVRSELERWFSRYPEHDRPELAKRFRSDRRGDCLAPFLELFLHEMLLRLDCNVEVHPVMPSRRQRPDFRATPSSGEPFLLEAVVAYEESDADFGAKRRRDDFLDALDRMKDKRWNLSVSVHGSPERPIPAAKIRSQIQNDLADLDSEKALAQDTRPNWRFKEAGWLVEIEAFPRSLSDGSNHRPIAALSEAMREVHAWRAVRDAVVKKAKGYGPMELPFVVAVAPQTKSRFQLDHTDAMQALFGQEAVEYSASRGGVETSGRNIRLPNGVWQGPKGRPRNRRLSACLLFGRLLPWSIPNVGVQLYHNPWARKPLDSVLCKLPQRVPDGSKMNPVEGTSLAQVFGLAVSWPGPME